MHRGFKTVVATLAVAGLTVGIAAAAAGGSQKLDLLGPDGIAYCDGSGVLSGEPGGFGFAIINAPSNGAVEATISAKNLTPNTTYNVLLIQGVADCYTPDGTITTTAQGKGNLHVSEVSTSTHALVQVVCTGYPCDPDDSFVTDTYYH